MPPPIASPSVPLYVAPHAAVRAIVDARRSFEACRSRSCAVWAPPGPPCCSIGQIAHGTRHARAVLSPPIACLSHDQPRPGPAPLQPSFDGCSGRSASMRLHVAAGCAAVHCCEEFAAVILRNPAAAARAEAGLLSNAARRRRGAPGRESTAGGTRWDGPRRQWHPRAGDRALSQVCALCAYRCRASQLSGVPVLGPSPEGPQSSVFANYGRAHQGRGIFSGRFA